jgi:hypothetical protein
MPINKNLHFQANIYITNTYIYIARNKDRSYTPITWQHV